MKSLIVLVLGLLAGCGSSPTLEQLEAQALRTGDWNLVERRQAILARKQARRGIDCPVGFVSLCQTRSMEQTCACVTRDGLATAIAFGY